MKSVHTLVLAFLLTGNLGTALAADWVPLPKASAVDQYFYDRSKLTIKGNDITYWKKVVFQAPQSIQGRAAVSGLLRERIDCSEHTAKLISYLYYADNGETLDYVAKDESEAAPIIPDTVGDAFERALCPKVWQKQEEARIKAEQKAAEAELAAIRKLEAAKDKAPPAPAATTAEPAPPTPPASEQQAPQQTPAAPESADPATPASGLLPEPKIIEQLY